MTHTVLDKPLNIRVFLSFLIATLRSSYWSPKSWQKPHKPTGHWYVFATKVWLHHANGSVFKGRTRWASRDDDQGIMGLYGTDHEIFGLDFDQIRSFPGVATTCYRNGTASHQQTGLNKANLYTILYKRSNLTAAEHCLVLVWQVVATVQGKARVLSLSFSLGKHFCIPSHPPTKGVTEIASNWATVSDINQWAAALVLEPPIFREILWPRWLALQTLARGHRWNQEPWEKHLQVDDHITYNCAGYSRDDMTDIFYMYYMIWWVTYAATLDSKLVDDYMGLY